MSQKCFASVANVSSFPGTSTIKDSSNGRLNSNVFLYNKCVIELSKSALYLLWSLSLDA